MLKLQGQTWDNWTKCARILFYFVFWKYHLTCDIFKFTNISTSIPTCRREAMNAPRTWEHSQRLFLKTSVLRTLHVYTTGWPSFHFNSSLVYFQKTINYYVSTSLKFFLSTEYSWKCCFKYQNKLIFLN